MKFGFRTEDFCGEGFRDAASVMAHETFDMCNTDILETLSKTILAGTELGNEMKHMGSVILGDIEDSDLEDLLDKYHDDESLGVQFYQKVLSEIKNITGHDIKYCLWLCDSIDDILHNYNINGDLDVASFDKYEGSDIILSDIGTSGKLYGYENEPKPIDNNIGGEYEYGGCMDNKIYWMNKEERAKLAVEKTNDREKRFDIDIDKSVVNGHVLFGPFAKPTFKENDSHCNIIVDNIDSVSAVYKYAEYKKPVCVLNFASFLNPGGKFLEGSSAQEESLCMDSILFNVLRRFSGFYANRKGNSNNCLYTDEAIYTPDIIFDKDDQIAKCDVITCAAVNASAARRWHKISENVIETMMMNRMKFVLDVATTVGVQTLILGAFGCGVFGNSPTFVATHFHQLLREYPFGYDRFFDTVVFAVPTLKEKDHTFEIFKDIFIWG